VGGGLFCSNGLGMNFADCCTIKPEFRICTYCNRRNIQHKDNKSFEKMSKFANVCYFFITDAFINVYYYFWTFNTPMPVTERLASLL